MTPPLKLVWDSSSGPLAAMRQGSPYCGPARLGPSPFQLKHHLRARSIGGDITRLAGRKSRRWTLSAAVSPGSGLIRGICAPAPDWPAHGQAVPGADPGDKGDCGCGY